MDKQQELAENLLEKVKKDFTPNEQFLISEFARLRNYKPVDIDDEVMDLAMVYQKSENFIDNASISKETINKVNKFLDENVSEVKDKDKVLLSSFVNEMHNDIEFSNQMKEVYKQAEMTAWDTEEDLTINTKQNNMEQTQPQQEKKFDVAEYLNNQMKYLGFGDNHKEAIQKGIDSKDNSFQIHTTSDKALFGNKAEFAINFNKSEKGGVFLNSFDAKLTTSKGEERSQNFRLNFTAKEAINLLEGRAVKTELQNKQGEKFNAFVKLNFAEEKNEFGNYKSKLFNENYGVDTGKIVDELKLKFDKPEYRENAIKALEKGNIIKAKFEHEGKEIQGKAFLNVEYKTLNLYNDKMQRLNNNKPLQGLAQDNSHEKNNVREQSISRGI